MKQLLTYIIADDDAVYLELTQQQLLLIPNLHCIAACESAVEIIACLPQQQPDLLILDVEMPGLSGIQFAKSLLQLPLLIFISSHKAYAVDAFDVDAIDFLAKPVAPERLIRAVEKARTLKEMKNNSVANSGFKTADEETFFIKDKNAFVKVKYSDVLYIESLGDFVNIFLVTGEKKIALVSMKSLEQQLPNAHFIRISRSLMVHKQKITAVETTMVSLGKIQLHVGKTFADAVMQAVVGKTAVKRFI